MNLNKKIAKFTGDGIPEYNKAINELIDAVNWLAGVRTINGKPIAESDQGPVLDLSQVNASQTSASPWANSPDGDRAGWSLITCLNLDTNQSFQTWIWTGQVAKNVRDILWAFDPSGKQAGWIVCTDNSFWGTGQCSNTGTTCPNFISPGTQSTGSTSPWTLNHHSVTLTPPTCFPKFYVLFYNASWTAPCFIWTNTASTSLTINWTFEITYDGVTVFSQTGSSHVAAYNPAGGTAGYLALNSAGFQFDPPGLPGYAYGSKFWVWPFNGKESSNTRPVVQINITWDTPPNVNTLVFPPDTIVFMQA